MGGALLCYQKQYEKANFRFPEFPTLFALYTISLAWKDCVHKKWLVEKLLSVLIQQAQIYFELIFRECCPTRYETIELNDCARVWMFGTFV